ncbi:MAG TPA: Rpn family recombination-promoting nuclease/putative transposase, partial [Tissierellales bacterium]|nr:Rpn family recombination-promoting nuclease/putative transposase [Tissierellales bacterium]
MGTKELLSPLNDLVFKALFGREQKKSKIILIDFLNSILNLDEEDKIIEIIHLNPFNLKEFEGDKGSVLDLKVKTEKEERINIEVQVNKEDDFRKRSLYYWSKMYGDTILEGKPYSSLKKSIVINIMDFIIIDETSKYHTEYQILEKNEHFLLTEDLSIHYIELPKFDDKKDIEYMEAVELWLTFMKRIGEPGTEELLNQLMERS